MKQKIVNKIFLVAVIKESKVIEILRGQLLENLIQICRIKYQGCELEVMEFNDLYSVYVPDIKEHLMMVRRKHANGIHK